MVGNECTRLLWEMELSLMEKIKCYIYTRVSTSIQIDGYSLDAQKDEIYKYIKS